MIALSEPRHFLIPWPPTQQRMSCWRLPEVGRQLRRSLSSLIHSKAVHFHLSDSKPFHLLILFTLLVDCFLDLATRSYSHVRHRS